MKKAIAIVLIAGLFAFNQEKKLKVELTAQQWEAIFQQLDKSAAPHNEIKITTGWLLDQLTPQLKDTTIKK